RGARAADGRHAGALPGRRRTPRRGAAAPVRGRGAQPGQPAPDPGGAVPAPLPDRCGRDQRRPAGPRGGGAAMTEFTGTWQLFRLAVRRDRVVGTVWVLGLFVFALSQAASIVSLYPTQADLDRLARG